MLSEEGLKRNLGSQRKKKQPNKQTNKQTNQNKTKQNNKIKKHWTGITHHFPLIFPNQVDIFW